MNIKQIRLEDLVENRPDIIDEIKQQEGFALTESDNHHKLKNAKESFVKALQEAKR